MLAQSATIPDPRDPSAHERCNLGARHRWGVEAGFLVEKHQGYQLGLLDKAE
jgi:hypothetical protein